MAKKKPYDFQIALDVFIHKAMNEGISMQEVSKQFKIESARMDFAIMDTLMKHAAVRSMQ